MHFVFQNREAAAATGKRAAEELVQNLCPAVTGKEIANRLAEIGKIQKSR
jgi:hypothetical protein